MLLKISFLEAERGQEEKKTLQSALCASTITPVLTGFAVSKLH